MGDQIENFRAVKSFRQQEKADRRADAPRRLTAEGLWFRVTSPLGTHIITRSHGRRVDLYPGTDRWKFFGEKKWHYGIGTFIDHAKGDDCAK